MLFWTGCALVFGCWHSEADTTPTTDAERNPAQMMLFHQHAEDFKGGRQLAVTVYIAAFSWNDLSAMGLYETVPDGWTFGGARAVAGTMPSVTPKIGDTGVLQFLWVEQSTAPVTFQYVLNIPPRESGARVLSGQVEYRLGEGALTSNVAFSQVTGVADALPVVTLRGAPGLSIAMNDRFSDPGATASDAEDGDLSGKIEVAGTVDTSEPGIYTLTYGVTDSVGNTSLPVTRQVTVSEVPSKPGTESPDTDKPELGGSALDPEGSVPPPLGPLAKDAPQRAPAIPRIEIPDVTLHKNAGTFEVPVKSGGETLNGEDGAHVDGGVTGGANAFRAARDSAGLLASGESERHGSATADAATKDAGARRPLVLMAVGGLMSVALIILWRQSHRHPRRTPLSR